MNIAIISIIFLASYLTAGLIMGLININVLLDTLKREKWHVLLSTYSVIFWFMLLPMYVIIDYIANKRFG